jgi:hypothetical protein
MHKFLTDEQLKQYDKLIDEDPYLSKDLSDNPIIREVCRAGIWLCNELDKIGCTIELRNRIQWTAGELSFGRDAWDVHQSLLDDYINGKLVFESDPLSN